MLKNRNGHKGANSWRKKRIAGELNKGIIVGQKNIGKKWSEKEECEIR